MSASRFPRRPDEIATALQQKTKCTQCDGVGTWTKKRYCGYCCGSGHGWFLPDNADLTADVEEIPDATKCDECDGSGVVVSEANRRSECSECGGFGLIFVACDHCDAKGVVLESSDCECCSGCGSTDFVDAVTDFADSSYIKYLIGLLLTAAGMGPEDDLTAYEPVLSLVKAVRQQLEDGGDDERLEELFGAFGADCGDALITEAGNILTASIEVAKGQAQERNSKAMQEERAQAARERQEMYRQISESRDAAPGWVRASNPYNG
jgi:hypothetical protein